MSRTASLAHASTASPVKTWLAVALLGIGAFVIVTTELAPIGLLSPIAGDLGRSEAAVGVTVTAYAWIGAASALLSSFWLGRLPRKPLLIGLMLVLAASNGLAALAHDYETLLAARILGAVAHGLFWAMIGALAARIAPPERLGLATAIVFGGVSAASVLGVPLANAIGQTGGWRSVFLVVTLLCILIAAVMAAVIPSVEGQAMRARDVARFVLTRRDLSFVLAVTLLAVTAHFAAFTFIEPFLRQMPGLSGGGVALMLLCFGGAGLVANFLAGMLIDRMLVGIVGGALAAMAGSLAYLGLVGPSAPLATAVPLILIWGSAIVFLFVSLQTWVLKLAGEAAMPASAVYVAVFNAAIGSGALLGAHIFEGAGPQFIDLVAAASAAAAFALVLIFGRAFAPAR